MSNDCVTDGLPDISKIDPIVFAPGENRDLFYTNLYYGIGKLILRSTSNSTAGKDKTTQDASESSKEDLHAPTDWHCT
jgi:hypothetical protein